MARDMKNSGIEWIGKIPKEWVRCKIKNICSLIGSGTTPISGNIEFYENGIINWIQSGDIYGKSIISEVSTLITDKALLTNKALKIYKAPFIVIAMYGASVGNTAISYIDACTNQACCCVKPKEDVELKFLFYWINICKIDFLFRAEGGGQPNISQEKIKNQFCVFPPINEQEKIANFLDKKCAEIDLLSSDIQSQISILEDYKKAVITEAVTKGLNPDVEMKDSGIEWIEKLPITWCKARIGYNSWIRARLGWKGLKAEEYVDKGYAFLSAFNIINNQLNWNDLNYINQERYDESPEIKLCIGDIILVKDGAGIGKCARIDALPVGEATTNGSLAVISTYNSLNYKYLYYYLQSSMFQNYILRIMNGMGVPHLSQEHLRKIIIPIPPIREQQEISDYLDYRCIKIDDAINEKREQLEVLEQYKKSLIYEYVTGKKEVIIND